MFTKKGQDMMPEAVFLEPPITGEDLSLPVPVFVPVPTHCVCQECEDMRAQVLFIANTFAQLTGMMESIMGGGQSPLGLLNLIQQA